MVKKVTIATLAKELGISESAVSKALNDYPDISPETKQMVLSLADERGYSPNAMARSLAKKTSNFVGIVIRDVSSIYGEMFKSLNIVARRYGLNLILYDTGNSRAIEKQCIQNLIDTMALGTVIVPVSEDISAVRKMTRSRVPVVYLGGKVRQDDVNYVGSDSAAGTELAMRHLIDQGHRKIAMLCDSKTSASRSRKIAMYQKMMLEIGMAEQIYRADAAEADLAKAGYQLVGQLLRQGADFTALFAVKDTLAIGAIEALREAGIRVPEEVSVVGYDGINASSLPMIELTTVAQPRMEMAEKIIDILRKHSSDPSSPPEHYLAKPELLIRSSTMAR